jgi:hypothetical protein
MILIVDTINVVRSERSFGYILQMAVMNEGGERRFIAADLCRGGSWGVANIAQSLREYADKLDEVDAEFCDV